ncbi:Zn(2)-C6 fungal-type domain-containing protein [Favolaschia claudopus]|uniref:Zn(2)-C6 fungal-type domain-containing protein n=1 Tax=Favolaschia claudopus TaxID=2862362 RepID=A0AAW0A5T5_9AGAR
MLKSGHGIPVSEALSIKRASGKAPCGECKRLKLKCDKTIPCSSCVRRGCGDTCPNGIYLPTGRGNRVVPTEASRLRRALKELEARRNELETTVTRLNKYHLDVCPYLGKSQGNDKTDELADTLGALSITDSGHTQYYGPSAGTEALLSLESPPIKPPTPPPTFTSLTNSFPIGFRGTQSWDPDRAALHLLASLPPLQRATHLISLYFANGCWSGTPITRFELDLLISTFYDTTKFPPSCDVHLLAVLYGVFALAALVDLALPPYSPESEAYFDLCRAALSVGSVFECPSVAAVQALALVSIYHSHGGSRFSMEGAWSVITLASTLCKTLGLHTSRVPPNLNENQIQGRRALFWEIYTMETLQSLCLGRPPGTYLSSITCPFPAEEGEHTDDSSPYYQRRWRFVKQVAAPILETYLTASPPPYSTIVKLDHQIRKFMSCSAQPTPAQTITALPAADSPTAYMQRTAIQQACMMMLVYIHTPAFVLAMRENPDDPYYTSHATSFLSAYRYAAEIVRANIDHFRAREQGELWARWWPNWGTLFNAAMVVGTVAATCGKAAYGPQALLELFVAVELFEGGAAVSYRARGALIILYKLRARAMASYAKLPSSDTLNEAEVADAETDETIAVFAGRTRIVAQRILLSASSPSSTTASGLSTLPSPHPQPPNPTAYDDPMPMQSGPIPPILVEYFQTALSAPTTADQNRPECRGYSSMMEHWESFVDFGGMSVPLFDVPSQTAAVGELGAEMGSSNSPPGWSQPRQWVDLLEL